MTYKTLPKPSQSNKQIREYTEAVEKGYHSIFVSATSEGWNVTLARNQKVVATFDEKGAAIAEAKKRAATTKGKFFVFDKAGELVVTN